MADYPGSISIWFGPPEGMKSDPRFPPPITLRQGEGETNYVSREESEALVSEARAAGREEGVETLWKELNEEKPTLHFCMEWDFLLIDKTHDEFEACGCGPFPLKFKPEKKA